LLDFKATVVNTAWYGGEEVGKGKANGSLEENKEPRNRTL
jgi:hypothetical protein